MSTKCKDILQMTFRCATFELIICQEGVNIFLSEFQVKLLMLWKSRKLWEETMSLKESINSIFWIIAITPASLLPKIWVNCLTMFDLNCLTIFQIDCVIWENNFSINFTGIWHNILSIDLYPNDTLKIIFWEKTWWSAKSFDWVNYLNVQSFQQEIINF